MVTRAGVILSLAALVVSSVMLDPAPACCPAPPSGKPVVNADQTVLIIWDTATNTQHFIRQPSFKSAADDFGFLVPTPTQPELAESGNEAFPFLRKLTEPEVQKVPRPSGGVGCGCSKSNVAVGVARDEVRVLDEKLVAGFQAVVLEATSADALVRWLREHGYAFSRAVEAWARPYVEGGWKITALRVAKEKDGLSTQTVAASSLRLSFKTDRPLFPYREPDYQGQTAALGASHRLLRIYFVSDARYQGALTREVPWTGQVAWANQLSAADRGKILDMLKLPGTTGPSQWWLTEFEDHWPYKVAPADLYFARATDQAPVKRPPIVEYVRASWPTDVTVYATAAVLVVPPLWRRARGRRKDQGRLPR
jgi:hypothetical protein